jgi:hypothetical protein
MPKETIVTYPLDSFAKEHKELNELGVKVFLLDGWQIYLLLMQNFDYLSSEDQQNNRWFSACHVGSWRSKHFNELLADISLPRATMRPSRKKEQNIGASYFDLFLQIAGGEVSEGSILPDGFESSINYFVIFVSQEELYARRILELLAESFLTLQEDEPEVDLNNITVFIVSENEIEISKISRIVKGSLNRGNSPEEVAKELQNDPEFNYLGPHRKFDLKLKND